MSFVLALPQLGVPKPGGNAPLPAQIANLSGEFVPAIDPFFGGGELVYAQATANIDAQAPVTFSATFADGRWSRRATEVAATGFECLSIGIALQPLTTGEWGWFQVSGVVPVDCNASLAAGAKVGIAAAGKLGAVSGGNQVLGAVCVAAGSTTVAKAGCTGVNGGLQLQVPNTDGWFRGVFLSGTGIAAGCRVSDVDPSGRFVTLSLANTGAVNGTVTATYNNSTIYYNVLQLDRPVAQSVDDAGE